ncbi:hypothetical protein CDV31_015882 [Fusarium ambrosium]|uniref:ZZ-type domain-containing protein n=1 Tax=Fusarium ambrosium TaxID=131363 RepID=A0A428SHW1_9HYPO|nr:hypothetical protein CDV31_015882 [Fusarium ambrosium]
MRLLNSATLEIKEFFSNDIPAYAILSHRWLDGEVSLKDMHDGTATTKAGYQKIKRCCDQALKDGLGFAWVDTCCIDKTSSAELTESINSMYRWYQNAAVCYAYLADVETTDPSKDASFQESVWFTRGWTLQELIAPVTVEFFNCAWEKIGTKESLKDIISSITNIDAAMLEGADPDDFSIAKRMSWAAKRTTTRLEDRAYSLLGFFKVNMPMLYGEGERAFIRLQEEIMNISDDQSLFAWKSNNNNYRGLLAKSPMDFIDSFNIIPSKSKWNRIPYSLTTKGLSIELPMVAWAMETYLAALDCELENIPNSRVGIYLQLLPERDQYVRVRLEGTDTLTFEQRLASKAQFKQIYIRQRDYRDRPMNRLYGFWIRTLPTKITTVPSRGDDRVSEVNSLNKWSDKDRVLEIPTGSSGTAGSIWLSSKSGSRALKLGFDPDFNPICQFGGHLFSPVKPPIEPQSVVAQMDPSWMTLPRSQYLHCGDRLLGYCKDEYSYRISITNEMTGNRGMWVLDILTLDHDLRHDAICDNCGLDIYGTRFKCLVCSDFDYCSKCILRAELTHGSHDFQSIEHPRVASSGDRPDRWASGFGHSVNDNSQRTRSM